MLLGGGIFSKKRGKVTVTYLPRNIEMILAVSEILDLELLNFRAFERIRPFLFRHFAEPKARFPSSALNFANIWVETAHI